MSKNASPMKVVTGPEIRFLYCHVCEPTAINGGTPKYSISLIIPKSDKVTVAKIRTANEAAYNDGAGRLRGNGKTMPPRSSIKTPLRDSDIERPDDEAYANAWFINANSTTAPGIVDKACEPILDKCLMYSGVYGRAAITFYVFNSSGNRGIACGLQNLQLIRAGEPLGSKSSSEDDFEDVEDDEDFLA